MLTAMGRNLIVLIPVLFSSICFAADVQPLPPFTKYDRVLIMAPHPDDETIATAGVIQSAKKSGAAVKVMCFTNGDHNELSFIVYEKRIPLKSGEFIHMGETRRNETIAAMRSLGLEEADLAFLGYPDFGTMEILTKSVVSRAMAYSMPSGMVVFSRSRAVRPPVDTSSPLAPYCW